MLARMLCLTLAGSVTLLLLLAAETAFPRFWTYRWRYYVRLAVLAAFALPLSVPAFLAQPLAPSAFSPLWEAPAQVLCGIGGALAVPAPPPSSILPALAVPLWVSGAAVFALWRLAAWLRFSAAVRHCAAPAGAAEQRVLGSCLQELFLRRHVRLLVCTGLGAPALMGLLRPAVLLPRTGIPEDELRFILLHELTHLRRADIAYKLAAQAVNAMHWCNPLAWLLTRQLDTLCELSCDEAAVRGMCATQRKRYGLVLLQQIAAAQSRVPSTVPAMAGAKQMLQNRLENIMKIQLKNKRRTVIAALSALALCAAGATATLALAPAAEARNAVSTVDATADGGQPSIISPVPDTAAYRYISVSFGELDNHMGTDIVTTEGSDILAAADGKVVYTQTGGSSPYGNHVILQHEGELQTLYAHCERLLVKQGDTVTQGQAIATVGETGYATGPHCHFEIRKGTDPVDAEKYVTITNVMPTK